MVRRGCNSSSPRDSTDSEGTRAESSRVIFLDFGSCRGLGRSSERTRRRLGNDSGLCKTREKTRLGTREGLGRDSERTRLSERLGKRLDGGLGKDSTGTRELSRVFRTIATSFSTCYSQSILNLDIMFSRLRDPSRVRHGLRRAVFLRSHGFRESV